MKDLWILVNPENGQPILQNDEVGSPMRIVGEHAAFGKAEGGAA